MGEKSHYFTFDQIKLRASKVEIIGVWKKFHPSQIGIPVDPVCLIHDMNIGQCGKAETYLWRVTLGEPERHTSQFEIKFNCEKIDLYDTSDMTWCKTKHETCS